MFDNADFTNNGDLHLAGVVQLTLDFSSDISRQHDGLIIRYLTAVDKNADLFT